MNKSRIYKVAMVALAIVLLCVASQMQNWLNLERSQLGLTRLPPLKNAPPILAFTTVALGGFRGLIANALWMRASDMQEADKYYDMVQLADWITVLEPHFTQVWTYEAWNMAYNISVKFKNPEDRWLWLERGIVLLRDHGIPMNPDTALMYRELSWFFQHKMGQNLDDAHLTYKRHWAQEMQNVIGARADYDVLEHPKTPAEKERVRKLREVYKLDPAMMQKVDEEYGPFDWRLPDAHAVYWAELYRQHAKPTAEDQDSLRRSIFQSMRMATFRGSLSPSVTNVTEQNFMLWPNFDIFPKVIGAYEKMIAEQPNSNFQNGHRNDLKEVIPLLYMNGREKEAAYWFDYLNKTYTNAFVGKQKGMSLIDFVLSTINTDNNETDHDRTTANIAGMYLRAFQCLWTDNDDHAQDYLNMAQRVREHYEKKIGNDANVRVGLKPLSEIRKGVLDYLMDPNPQTAPISPYAQNILRTKLGLKAPSASETPAVSSSSKPEIPPATDTNTPPK